MKSGNIKTYNNTYKRTDFKNLIQMSLKSILLRTNTDFPKLPQKKKNLQSHKNFKTTHTRKF